VPYWKIGAVSWREGEEIALVIVSRLRHLAPRLVVPSMHYAAARRLLRDKIAAHDIQLMHTGSNWGRTTNGTTSNGLPACADMGRVYGS
jgi:hypothetical protein